MKTGFLVNKIRHSERSLRSEESLFDFCDKAAAST
jgi:hypothetical protein